MRMTRYALGGLAAIVAVTLAAGCSSSAQPNSSAGGGSPAATAASPPSTATAPAAQATGSAAPDSCNVITLAEASAALGQPVQPPRRGKAYVEGGVACVFYGPNAPASVSPDVPIGGTVRVVLVTGPNAKKYFDDYRAKVAAQPISGIGDSAYYDGYASISVLKGDAYVRIAVGIANNLSAEETLARDALPRM